MNARQVGAVAFALLLVAGAAFAGVGGASVASSSADGRALAQVDDESTNETFGPADEVWVTEEGDLVLRYANETSGEETSDLQYGLAVGEGLFYALASTSATEDAPESASGEFHALLTRNALSGNGSLTAPRPESVESLSAEVESVANDEDAQFDATADVVVNNSRAGAASLVRSADLNAGATMRPSQFTAEGTLNASLATPLGQPQSQRFVITESDGDYTLSAAQEYTVHEFSRERWNTSERAKASLQAQYAAVAQSLGGSATVTLESYEFTPNSDGSGTLDVEFTVEYTGIDEGLAQQLTAALASAEDVDLTQEEAEDIASRVTELQVNRVDVSYSQSATGNIDAAFRVDVENYDQAVLAGLEAANSVDPESVQFQQNVDLIRKQFEARQAAGLVETVDLSASVSQGGDGTTTIAAESSYRTENWAAYREELASRDVPLANSNLTLSVATEGEEVVAEGQVTVEQDDLVGQFTEQLRQSMNASAETDPEARKALQFLGAFEAANFRRAKMDVTFDGGDVRVEAGAKFESLAALRDVATLSQGSLKVTEVVGRTENDTVDTYVYVEGGVSANASEEDVRALSVVDEDTAVHLPGTWDRSFPTMDRERARDYLGTGATPTANAEDETPAGTSSAGDGFGVTVALVALLGAALLAVRRRR